MLGSWWWGVVSLVFFQLHIQKKTPVHSLLTKKRKKLLLNIHCSEQGIYLKNQSKLGALGSGVKEMGAGQWYGSTFLLISVSWILSPVSSH